MAIKFTIQKQQTAKSVVLTLNHIIGVYFDASTHTDDDDVMEYGK